MAYSTNITEAIVCGTFNRNTADRSYLLFTREAGMLYAEAKSVREERSRQRMALQDFSLVRVSLIKGRNSWKIGSIESDRNFYSIAVSKEARGSVVGMVKFLRRFYAGQEAAPALFDYVVGALAQLASHCTSRDFFERIAEVRILCALGYADMRSVPDLVYKQNFDEVAASEAENQQHLLEKIIEKAVATSHL